MCVDMLIKDVCIEMRHQNMYNLKEHTILTPFEVALERIRYIQWTLYLEFVRDQRILFDFRERLR